MTTNIETRLNTAVEAIEFNSKRFESKSSSQLSEQSKDFQLRFTTLPKLPWQPSISVTNQLQVYTYVDSKGIEKTYLPDPVSIPFETSLTFDDDLALGRWYEDSVLTEQRYNNINFSQYDNNRSIAKAVNEAALPNEVFVKRANVSDISVLVASQNGTATEYLVSQNADSMFDIESITVGICSAPEAISQTITTSGNWITNSPPNFYTQEVGASFQALAPASTKIEFNSFVDDRGGVWDFTIFNSEGDIVASKRLSVYSATSTGKTFLIAKGLTLDDHTVYAEFKGAHPLNVSDSRGWAREDGILYSNELHRFNFSKSSIVMDNSVCTFAMTARSSVSNDDLTWVPAHGGKNGVCTNVTYKLYVDGLDMKYNSIDDLPTEYEKVNTVTIHQTYSANNYYSIGTELWKGVLLHTFSLSGWDLTHQLSFSTDTYIGSGYLMMFPALRDSFTHLYLEGNSQNYEYELGLGTSNDSFSACKNALFYGGEIESGRYIMLGMTSDSLHADVSVNKIFATETSKNALLTRRADGVCKLYYIAAQGTTIPSGERITVSRKVTAGISRYPIKRV
ncbi:hypothetical protein EBM76_14970 [Vibrio parahaemolyticus]|nr:hypothetical protein [Vibrio parahaemolyticus]